MKQHLVILFFICFSFAANAQTTWGTGSIGFTGGPSSPVVNNNFFFFQGSAWWFPVTVWTGLLDVYPWITNTPPSIWTDPNGNQHHYGLLNTTNYAQGTANGQQSIVMLYDEAGNRIVRDVAYDIGSKTAKNNDDKAGIVELDPNEAFSNSKAEITVFPNPTCDKITVELSESLGDAMSLELINSDGKVMLSQSADLYNRLDISSYPSGSYVVLLRSGKASKQWRVKKI